MTGREQPRVLWALLVLASCAQPLNAPDASAADSGETADAGAPDAGAPDAGAPDAGAPDAGAPDAGAPDAGAPDAGAPDAGAVTATVFPRVGAATDSVFTPSGPGLILMGGGRDVDAAFVWMRTTLSSTVGARLGDVVVLRATGANAYTSYIYGLAPFSSVQTVLLPAPSTPADLLLAASIVDRAEAVFFAGGDQSHYTAWAGSPLIAAVQRVYARGGVVGGTSAGLAILGQFVYDARVGSATSAEALANPYAGLITFTRDELVFPSMAGLITDTHFANRDRLGRLTVFMARQIADGAITGGAPKVLGVGVDEETAIVVDSTGRGTLLRQGASTGAAYFVLGGAAAQVAAGQPLIYPSINVTRIDAANQYYDFAKRCGSGPAYVVSVDATKPDPFGGVNPYTASGAAAPCP